VDRLTGPGGGGRPALRVPPARKEPALAN
jgi:hypothetical protein